MKPANTLCQQCWCVNTDHHMICALNCILSNIALNVQGLNFHIFLSEGRKGHLRRDQNVLLKKKKKDISLLFDANGNFAMDHILPF